MRRGGVVVPIMVGALAVLAAAEQGLVLRYRYATGRVERYALKAAFTVTGPTNGPLPGPGSYRAEGVIKLKTISVSTVGVASQEARVERMEMTGDGTKTTWKNGTLTVQMNGQPYRMTREDQENERAELLRPMRQEVDARGEVTSARDRSDEGLFVAGLNPLGLEQQMSVIFPDGPVAPGQTWAQTIKLLTGAARAPDLTVGMTYKFVRTEKYKGADVARISFEGKGRFAEDSLKHRVSGYQLFDSRAGVARYINMKTDQAIAILMPAGGAKQSASNKVIMAAKGEIELARQ